MVRLLLDEEAAVATKNKNCKIALLLVARSGREAVVRLLLGKGPTSKQRMIMDRRRFTWQLIVGTRQ